MRNLLIAAITFVSVLAAGLTVPALPVPAANETAVKAETYLSPAGDFACGRPCVITESDGGSMLSFEAVALQLMANKVPIVVDGPCFSACTLLVDMARDQVCITSNAVLGYHQAFITVGEDTKYRPIHYTTPGLEDYFKAHGGMPADRYDLLLMPFWDAQKFYKVCSK